MPMGTQGRPTELDEKLCFDTWKECTTLKKAHSYLKSEGYKYSLPGIRHAAWRYMVKHPDETFEFVQSQGAFPDGKTEEWNQWIAAKIRTYTNSSNKRFNDTLKLHGIYKWYYEQKRFEACPVRCQGKIEE